MAQDKHYDVIIIGTGAGGGTLVHTLASTGKSILILERGDYVRREKANWDSRAVNVEGKYQTKEEWLDKDGRALHPHTNYYVGGNTKFYGAALFRLRKEDFGEIRHFGGISPAWPISYDELEPYYLKAEKLYHVRGKRGEDPTDPYASGPYPHPAISHEPRIQQLSDDFERLGLKPFHTPLGLQRDEQNLHASKCIRCDTCDGYPCLVDAKSDAQVLCVDPALRFPNVTLLTNAYVKRLETNASGNEISRVVVSRNGAREHFSAGLVVVSCGAINSAVLLLRSATDKHPRGLANGSDVVGRHYMGHTNSVMLALSKCPNPTIYQKSLSVNDFYFGSKEWHSRRARRRSLRVGLWISWPSTPSASGSPRKICRILTIALPSITKGKSFSSTHPTTKSPTAVCLPSSKSSCSSKPNAACTATNVMKGCSRGICSSVTVFPSPAWHTRTARSASGVTPRRLPWTRIARRTRLTIYTSWTAVSSLPAAPLIPR